MSGLHVLNIAPEMMYAALAACAALLAGAGIWVIARSARAADEAPPAPKSFPRGTGPKSAPGPRGSKFGPKSAARRPAPPTDSVDEADEAYLREHSMLPDSPENAGGGSDPFLEGGSHERRGAPRRRGNPIDVLLSDADAEIEPISGIVLDRSSTGLALELWSEGEVAPGTVISVRPRRTTANTVWTKVVVKRCEKRRTSWVLGCQYVRAPGMNAMMEFG